MIQYNWDLFYGIYNTITEHNPRQTHYLSSILNYCDMVNHESRVESLKAGVESLKARVQIHELRVQMHEL